jgi:uncharacterized protein (DUF1810 family)
MMVQAPFDLQRFITAQGPVIAQAQRELSDGCKRSHWMWFVFPQLRGLGRSETAQRYGVANLAEAEAYLGHPMLGPRLIQCSKLVNAVEGRSVHDIFGSPDDLKFHSSMTLFAAAGPSIAAFRTALDRYFSGQPDQRTIELLWKSPSPGR